MSLSIFDDIRKKSSDMLSLYVFQNFYENRQNLTEFPGSSFGMQAIKYDATYHRGPYRVSEKVKDNIFIKEYLSNSPVFKKTITHLKNDSPQKSEAVNLLVEGEHPSFSEDFIWFKNLLSNNPNYLYSSREGLEIFTAKIDPFNSFNIHISSPDVYNVELKSDPIPNHNIRGFSFSQKITSTTLKAGSSLFTNSGIVQNRFTFAHNPAKGVRFISMEVNFGVFPSKNEILAMFKSFYTQNGMPLSTTDLGFSIKISLLDPNLIQIFQEIAPVYRGQEGFLDSLRYSRPMINDVTGEYSYYKKYSKEELIKARNLVNTFRDKFLNDIRSLDQNLLKATIGAGFRKIIFSIGNMDICTIGLI